MVALAPCVVVFSSSKGSAQVTAKASTQTVSLVNRGFTSVSVGSGTTVRLLLATGVTYRSLTGPGSMAVPVTPLVPKASYSCTGATVSKARQAAARSSKTAAKLVARPTLAGTTAVEHFASNSLSLTPVESASHCWVVIGVLLLALYLCTTRRGFRF